MLILSDINHSFTYRNGSSLQVIDDVGLSVPEHTFVSLLGPSGCGKTTLLRIASGLIRPTSGTVDIDGERISGPARDRAMVFQDFNLLPWRTTLRNVELGLEIQGMGRAERRKTALESLEDVGLGKFANHYPHQLSGGMKQRVGLARALCTKPRYLMMDEPFGALDPQIRELLQIELIKLWEEDRKTVLFVTHSVDEAIMLSDRVVVFSRGPGSIIHDIEIKLPRPRWGNTEEIRETDEFTAYRTEIWGVLKQEVALNQ